CKFLFASGGVYRGGIGFDHPADEVVKMHSQEPRRAAATRPVRKPVDRDFDSVFHPGIAVEYLSHPSLPDGSLDGPVLRIEPLVEVHLHQDALLLCSMYDL